MSVYDPLETVWALGTTEHTVREVRVGADEEVLVHWARRVGHVWAKPLAYPLPAALADQLRMGIQSACEGGETRPDRLAGVARRELEALGLPRGGVLRACDLRRGRGEGLPPVEEVSAIRAALEGRRLFASEVARFLPPEVRLFPEQVARALEYLRLTGEVVASAGVHREGGTWQCARCGSRRIQPAPCANCGDPACLLCCDCSVLGEARACRRLHALAGSSPERALPPVALHDPGLPPSLTAAQRQAAGALLAWLRDPEAAPTLLLWAVCGAGKTLAVRPLVELAAASGWRVLYASPRREVIRQVRGDLPAGAVTLLTTHQTLRWEAAFDLIILDEPDAFPYRGNLLLERAVRRAGRAGSRRVFLTATPDAQMLAAVSRGEMVQVLLPIRHHGHPVPVPELLTVAEAGGQQWARRQGETALAAELMTNQARSGRRVLVFVPTVDLGRTVREELEGHLERRGRAQPVWWVHAGHPERSEIIAGFRRGDCKVLVSTSVLERGVTFPAIDVIVLHADHALFDRASLLQMAGRAGRTTSDPFGQVWFIGAEVTADMLAARQWVTAMNERAACQ